MKNKKIGQISKTINKIHINKDKNMIRIQQRIDRIEYIQERITY